MGLPATRKCQWIQTKTSQEMPSPSSERTMKSAEQKTFRLEMPYDSHAPWKKNMTPPPAQ